MYALLLAAAAVGIDAGWEPRADGGLVYILQIPPDALEALRGGQQFHSDIPLELKGLRSWRIQVGTGPLPRNPLLQLTAKTTPATQATTAQATTAQTTAAQTTAAQTPAQPGGPLFSTELPMSQVPRQDAPGASDALGAAAQSAAAGAARLRTQYGAVGTQPGGAGGTNQYGTAPRSTVQYGTAGAGIQYGAASGGTTAPVNPPYGSAAAAAEQFPSAPQPRDVIEEPRTPAGWPPFPSNAGDAATRAGSSTAQSSVQFPQRTDRNGETTVARPQGSAADPALTETSPPATETVASDTPTETKPWPLLLAALLGMAATTSGMLYFGWIAWDYRNRYRAAMERLLVYERTGQRG